MGNNIILRKVEFSNGIVHFKFDKEGPVSNLLVSNELWIDYGRNMESVPESILVIPFVSIMLPFVWVSNATIWVKEIDHTFYDATFRLRRAYSDLYPNYPLKGKIVPSYIVDNFVDNKSDGFMLFSGGLDAHASFIRNVNDIKTLINIQGWYNNTKDRDNVAIADFKDIAAFSKIQDLDFIGIRSNFAKLVSLSHYQYYAKRIGDSLWHGFQHSMAFISITIPLVYLNNGGKILIASSFTVGDERVCASYPTTDNEFAFASNGHVVHDGFELSRQDKIRVLVEHQRLIGKDYPIRVCSFNDKNCCKCEKCFRTILGLVAEGVDLEKFGFYLDKPILEFYTEFFKANIALFGVKNEAITHWPHIKKRMSENYDNLGDYKNFVDWFNSYDFSKEKRKAIWKYYRKNFFQILKRKLNLSNG